MDSAELKHSDRRWLSSLLLSDSLRWTGNRYTDSQHRGCALRASGTTEIVRAAYGETHLRLVLSDYVDH
ncbi:MAG TPA: hypothetical protein DHU96_34820 [Actinobacteria bacterium]|nr:hypothetical protein [Actinomycetota bacterium]